MNIKDFISKKTRNEFREFLVGSGGWTLRMIEDEFSAVGLEPVSFHDPQLGSRKRDLVEQYYHSADFTNLVQVKRVLRVYEAILIDCETSLADPRLYDDVAAELKGKYDKLLSCLRRDGYTFEDERLRAKGDNVLLQHLPTTATLLDADYLYTQVDRLVEAVEQDSELAIGQAKELVETCCKTILVDIGESDDNRLDLGPLVKKTMKHLRLLPEDIPERARGMKTIKALLGNLAMISQGMAELRNLYGTCLLYTSPSPRDGLLSRMPSSA